MWIYKSSPIQLHGVVLKFVEHRDNFTLLPYTELVSLRCVCMLHVHLAFVTAFFTNFRPRKTGRQCDVFFCIEKAQVASRSNGSDIYSGRASSSYLHWVPINQTEPLHVFLISPYESEYRIELSHFCSISISLNVIIH
jgi:hypothetical protein